jgi:putative FmdB family regulatory protein
MPIFEYDCLQCRDSFAMIHGAKAEDVKCPKCGSEDIKKKISSFSSCKPGCGSGATGGFGGGFKGG